MVRPIIEDERCGELWITLLTSSRKAREKQTHHSAVIELSQCVIFTLSQPLIAPVSNTAKFQRIWYSLRRVGTRISEKIVRRIMRQEKLYVYYPRKRRFSSYCGEVSPEVPNLLQRNFQATEPNQKWLTDITEFSIPAGKVYLSPIIDCYDGMPVSWTIGTSPTAELANTMLKQAIAKLESGDNPIIHSDRGGHYRWPEWIEITKRASLIRSMSKKGCSPDNAACEGFFGRLKNEMFYHRDWYGVSLPAFIKVLDGYLNWYANKRIKVSLGGLSPAEFRQHNGQLNQC